MVISLVGALPHVPLTRLWRAYEAALERRPILTQSCTSAVLWGVGDLLAQRLSNCSNNARRGTNTACTWDARRTALTSAFGAAFIGPAGHYWYTWLDKFALMLGPQGSRRFLAAKVAADATVWSAAYLFCYFCWGALVIDGASVEGLKQQLSREFVPTLTAEVAAWPPLMAGIFSRLPSKHHLLAVNLFTVCDVVFLAMIQSGALSLQLPNGDSRSCSEDDVCVEGSHASYASSHMHMVPALASMHTASSGGSGTRKAAKGGQSSVVTPPAVQPDLPDAPAALVSQLQQVFAAWVPAEHRPPC